MSKRCPREGTRVVFDVTNPAVMRLYAEPAHSHMATVKLGERGEVTTVPVPGGRRTCMPGPRGGMVYVKWQYSGVQGVFRNDLRKSSGALLGGTRKRARRRKKR